MWGGGFGRPAGIRAASLYRYVPSGFQLKHNDPLAAAAMLTTLFKSAGASSVAAAAKGAAAGEVKG